MTDDRFASTTVRNTNKRCAFYLGRHAGHGGGIAVYIREMVRELPAWLDRNPDFECVVCGHNVLPDAPALVHPRCKLLPLTSCFSRQTGLLLDQLLLPWQLRQREVQWVFSLANVGLALCRRQVVTIHDLFQAWPRYIDSKRPTPAQLFYRTVFRRLVPRASHLIADGPIVANELVARFAVDDSRVSVVPLGLDRGFAEALSALSRSSSDAMHSWLETHGLQSGYVVLLASADPRKNIAAAVAAYLAAAARHTSELPLVAVASDAAIADTLRQLVSRCDPARAACMTILPWFDRIDLPKLYLAARCLLVPSHDEGFGLPALEATACGCPVVTGPNDSVGEGNPLVFRCNTRSQEDIANQLLRCVASTDPSIGARLQMLRSQVDGARTMHSSALETLEIYRRFLE